jgi:hypothetical protein|tara:strand:+ start:46 stop:666 length:621 start_codon:yes stop_codon:yes gene_type:complete
MANRQSGGYGLRPVNTLGNTPATSGQSKYWILSNYNTAIYNGEPVKWLRAGTSGTDGVLTNGCASTTNVVLGVFNGCFYNAATTKKPTWSNYYPASTVPANSENIVAFVNDNPFQEYQIAKTAAVGATPTDNDIIAQYGQLADTSASAESTGGRSSVTLGTPADSGLGWTILRSAEDPDNSDFGAAYANVIVMQNLKYNTLVVGIA